MLSVYITDNHCTPDDGDGKEGERGKNGSPTIYVMRIIAASVRPCHAGEGGRQGPGCDLKIIRVVHKKPGLKKFLQFVPKTFDSCFH